MKVQNFFWQKAWEMGFITGLTKATDDYAEHIKEVMEEMDLSENPEVFEFVEKVIFKMKIENHDNKTRAISLGETMMKEEFSDGTKIDKELLQNLIKNAK